MGDTLKPKSEEGLSLIEVMMAAFVITVSLLGVAMTMVRSVGAVFYTQQQLVAKQKAREALESVFTARSTQDITFNQIQGTSVTGGIFLEGFQSIRGMGVDGIANTADDSATAIETLTFPGADGLLGTADDEVRPLSSYERKITITNVLDTNGNVDADIRQITVEVRFKINKIWKSVSVSSFVSRYA
jgi:type II secretory pathway pseudopilin PulG